MNASTLSEVFSYRQKTCDLFDTAGAVDAVREDGFALIPGVLSASEIAAAREALDRLQPFGLDGSRWSELNHHFKCVFNRDRLWLSYADRPGIIESGQTHLNCRENSSSVLRNSHRYRQSNIFSINYSYR
ncbi:hypothetical protein QUB47_16315 [Microcoleus sp. AT9_B5]